MNGLKIRKLAAIVAGGALLGAAVAPMVSAQLTSDQVKSTVYDSGMSPVMNVVVGETANILDGVWAGNLVRKMVEQAVTTKTFDGTSGGNGSVSVTDLEAVLALGGTVTVTGGKTLDNAFLNSVSGTSDEYSQEITQDPLTFLRDESITYKYNGSNESIDVKEIVGVKLDAQFNTDNDVRDLVTNLAAGDVNYTLNLGSGIPLQATDSAIVDFEDGSDDNVRIPFFGKTFLVQRVDVSSTGAPVEVRLIEDKAKQTFVAGESFTMAGVGEYDGQTLTVTVVSIVATGPAAASFQAKFNVTDEAGNLIDTQTVESGSFVEFEDIDGDEVVGGDIYVDTASVNTGTNEGTVDVLVGTASVRLLNGENYPYSEDADADNVDGPYTVTLVGDNADSNRLTQIVISNQEKDDDDDTTSGEIIQTWGNSVFDDDTPFYSKNSALTTEGQDGTNEFSFLDGTGALGEDFFKISFTGFENDEELTHVMVGSNEVEFRDAQDSTHTIPMWWKEDAVTGSAVAGSSEGKKFTFDGSQELWYDLNTSSQDFNVTNGTVLNGVVLNMNNTTKVIASDAGDTNALSAGTVMIRGTTYTIVSGSPLPAAVTTVTLRADGFIRVADSELDSDVDAADLVNGINGSAPNTVTAAGGGMTAAQLADVFFYDDAAVSGSTIGVSTAPMLLPLSGDNYTTAYSYFVSETGSNNTDDGVYFMLYGSSDSTVHTTGNGQSIPHGSAMQNSKQLAFLGTDTAEDGTPDKNFYFPQIDDLAQDDASSTVYSATFQVDENNGSTYPARFYIDTQTDQLPNTDDDDISFPSSDVNYGWNASSPGANGVTFNMEYEDDDSLEMAWTDFGTKISIADHQNVEFWIPENRPQIEYIVSGASTTTEVEGGEEITVAEGETGTFSTGTTVAVKDITYTATIVGGGTGSTVVTNGAPFTYTTPAPLNGKAMVYTTASVPAGPKIIVGGPLVNALAQEVADMLNAPGDVVAGVYGTNIIVAGYTAEDTGQAVQDLIDALDAI